MYQERGNRTFVVLHGTGGDEYDLLPIAEEINADYSQLSLRGNVQEHGMNRFFERYPDMTFNIESIQQEVTKLHTFLKDFIQKHNKSFDDLVFLGYSNGANFALSFLFLYPNLVKKAILLHPMIPFIPKDELNLSSTQLFVSYGEHDPYSTVEHIEQLQNVLENAQAHVEYVKHEGGHEIRKEEIHEAKTHFLTSY